MTYKILTDDTKKVIYRLNVRSALTKEDRNKRVDLLGGEEVANIIKSLNDEDESPRKPMPIFDPTDLVGRTFLMDPQENGERYCTKILEALVESEEQLAKHPDRIKFVCSVNDDMYEEILTYNEILEYIAKNEEQDADQAIVWKFKRIAGHQGPLKKGDPGYDGSKFNVLVEWETGESTYEPLDVIAADDPITCAIYAKEKGLLDEPSWRRFKSIAKRESQLLCMMNQAKFRSFRRSPKYKFGYQVPNNHAEAMLLDKKNHHSKWADAKEKERACFREYQVFKDIGKNGRPPASYKPLKILMVYDVKHDSLHRACMVAAGHLTEVPVESMYSGVISL